MDQFVHPLDELEFFPIVQRCAGLAVCGVLLRHFIQQVEVADQVCVMLVELLCFLQDFVGDPLRALVEDNLLVVVHDLQLLVFSQLLLEQLVLLLALLLGAVHIPAHLHRLAHKFHAGRIPISPLCVRLPVFLIRLLELLLQPADRGLRLLLIVPGVVGELPAEGADFCSAVGLDPLNQPLLSLRPNLIQLEQKLFDQRVRQFALVLEPELVRELEGLLWHPQDLFVDHAVVLARLDVLALRVAPQIHVALDLDTLEKPDRRAAVIRKVRKVLEFLRVAEHAHQALHVRPQVLHLDHECALCLLAQVQHVVVHFLLLQGLLQLADLFFRHAQLLVQLEALVQVLLLRHAHDLQLIRSVLQRLLQLFDLLLLEVPLLVEDERVVPRVVQELAVRLPELVVPVVQIIHLVHLPLRVAERLVDIVLQVLDFGFLVLDLLEEESAFLLLLLQRGLQLLDVNQLLLVHVLLLSDFVVLPGRLLLPCFLPRWLALILVAIDKLLHVVDVLGVIDVRVIQVLVLLVFVFHDRN